MKGRGGYGIAGLLLVLFVAVAVLPIIRRTFARSFPEGFQSAMGGGVGIDARTRLDCKGVNCQEGEFCQDNVCRPVYPAITNNYFPEK